MDGEAAISSSLAMCKQKEGGKYLAWTETLFPIRIVGSAWRLQTDVVYCSCVTVLYLLLFYSVHHVLELWSTRKIVWY